MKKIAGNPYLKIDKNTVLIDDLPLESLLERYETPLMIFLENRLRNNLNTFKNVFASVFNNFQGFYSFKANYLPEICKIVQSEGFGAEVVGLPELKLALNLGFNPRKILVGGPFLQKELIKEAIKHHVKEIIVYNLNDLEKINLIAQKFETVQNICIRINSLKYGSKLGVKFDEKSLKHLKNIINENSNIKILSILSHYTSQMNSIEQFKKNIQSLATNLKKLKEIGIIIENINLGGGFPEAVIIPEAQLEKMAKYIRNFLRQLGIKYKQIYFEPGRYFVGDTGLFISEIVKVSEDRWIFLNIGNHICPKFARCPLRFYNLSQINMPHKFKTSFAGIMPTDQDVLTKDYFFTKNLNEGDKVLVTNVGAYTLTFSNRFPYPLPKILLVKNNNYRQIFDPLVDHDISIY